MTPVLWMVGVGLLSWLAIRALEPGLEPELGWGLAGPLLATVCTWVAVRKMHAAAPERLQGVMVMGFVLKAVFFGTYVVVMLRVLAARPVPFVASFTGFFIVLYAIEALFLNRLVRNATR